MDVHVRDDGADAVGLSIHVEPSHSQVTELTIRTETPRALSYAIPGPTAVGGEGTVEN
jgi:hypothetical protein